MQCIDGVPWSYMTIEQMSRANEAHFRATVEHVDTMFENIQRSLISRIFRMSADAIVQTLQIETCQRMLGDMQAEVTRRRDAELDAWGAYLQQETSLEGHLNG